MPPLPEVDNVAADRAGSVAGIVLAAGGSIRMRQNKLLLTLEAETVLRRAARRATEAGLDPVVVVLGDDPGRMREELAGLRCNVVVNGQPSRGQTSSLQVGLESLPARSAGAVVMLADMPFVTSEMVAAVVTAWRGSSSPLVVSEYGGVLAPPMLYDRSLFEEIGGMQGDGCGKRIIKAHRAEALVVAQPADALADLDTPDDYERVLSRLAAAR